MLISYNMQYVSNIRKRNLLNRVVDYLALLFLIVLTFSCNPLGVEGNMGGGQISNTVDDQSPIIIRVVPEYGDIAGGTELSVTGAYFQKDDKFYIGDKECVDVLFISSSEIKCTSPDSTSGSYDIKIENSKGNNYILTNAYQYLVTSIRITGPNSGNDFSTSKQEQVVHGTCSKNINILRSNIGTFFDENCSDGTWSLDPYSLSSGQNVFAISGEASLDRTSSSDDLTINYSDNLSSIIISNPNNGNNFSTNVQAQTLYGTCSNNITDLNSTLGIFSDDDCSDGSWSLEPFSLLNGSNDFVISGSDTLGNQISDSLSIVYDTISPSISITLPNSGVNFVTDELVQTVSGTCGTDVVSLTSSIGNFSDSDCSDGAWSLNSFVLAHGVNTFLITAYDGAGNSSITSVTITYDNSTYSISITSPNNGVNFSTNVETQTISGICSTGLTSLSTSLGNFNDSDCSDGTWSLQAIQMNPGSNTFTISGLDPLSKAVSNTIVINYDTAVPSLAITSPNNGSSFITNSLVQTVSGTCGADVVGLDTSIGNFLDNDCSNGSWSLNPYVLSSGANTFTITAYDSAGNSSTASLIINYDNNTYSLNITGPNSGINFYTKNQNQNIYGACSVGITQLTSSLGTFADSDCADGTWSLSAYSLSAGVNNFTITGKDPLNNTVSDSISITYDTMAPVLSITAPNAGLDFTTQTIIQTISGDCGVDVVNISTSLGNFADNNCSDGTWSLNSFLLNLGMNTFTITATDFAGNTSSSTINIVYDDNVIPPDAPTINGVTPTTNKTPTWSWVTGGGIGTYRYKLDSADFSSGVTETNSTSYTPASDLSTGTHTLYVKEKNGSNIWSDAANYMITIDVCNPVVSWGRNTYGQLGVNTTSFAPEPVDVPGISTVVKVAVSGMGSTMVLKSDGTLWGWGTNDYGLLGDGTTATRSSPTKVLVLDNVADFETGSAHAIARKTDGSIWLWGYGGVGQIGDASNSTKLMPTKVYGVQPFSSGSILKLAVGSGSAYTNGTMSAVVRDDGTVWTWGGGGSGQLGVNSTANYNYPVQVLGQGGSGYLTNVVDVKIGAGHVIALKSDGTVWAWGFNNSGQIGNNVSGTNALTPVQVLVAAGTPLTGITSISAGLNHNFAIRGSDGSLWGWGLNTSGQLGDGTNVSKLVATQVKGSDTGGFILNVSKVSAGSFHSVALKGDGTVWAWGANLQYLVGDGTNTTRYQPVQITSLSNNIAMDIRAASEHTAVLTASGTVKVWGANYYGQMNIGEINRLTPVPLSASGGYDNSPISDISAGTNNSVMIRSSDGSVWSSGSNINGQIGDGSSSTVAYTRTSPVQTKDLGGTDYINAVSQVSFGGQHAMLLKNGEVYSWGYNANGRLGDNTTSSRSFPVRVVDLSPGETYLNNIISISAGNAHSLALKSDGTVWAWGSNGSSGTIGVNTTTTSYIYPQKVLLLDSTSPLSNITAIASSSGATHSLALKDDGTVWAWGFNSNGQIGDNTSTNRKGAVQVAGLTNIIAISVGNLHSMALRSDGTVWAWGYNVYYNLGDGTNNSRTQPVQVISISDVTAISAGGYHSMALKSDGTVWTWGQNNYGQIGDNTVGYIHMLPTQVSGLTHVTKINAGETHNLAVVNCNY